MIYPAMLINLFDINPTYRIIAAVAAVILFVWKAAKKAIKIVLAVVIAIALLMHFGLLAGLPLPFS